MPDEPSEERRRGERRVPIGPPHTEQYPDVPFLEHVSLMVRGVQQEAELKLSGFIERYQSEQELKDRAIEKAEKANETHFGLINGLQARQDTQQREHTADLVRVRGEMASHEALAGLRMQMEERISALSTWKIEQQAIQQTRDEAQARRMWLVGVAIGVFSILLNLVIRLMTEQK